ncbi:MAG: ATP-dependent DNA helicase [Candidatus Shapirobacteria bacterium]|nr:ATP-dependent DNA helicase [Candidatus Shapirobacteria bacterium]
MATIISSDKFYAEYNKLNPEQKQAADTIEGPVMVIAGAGTGKTQTIALRIANILLKTQTPAYAILCLTFTETGAAAMRQRLLDIIGLPAYGVKIHTFHSFCNEIIKTNPEYFIFAKNIDSLEELERIEIIQSLIEKLPDGAILKPWGDHFYYQREIISKIQTLKRENITPDIFLDLIQEQKEFLKESEDLFLKLKTLRANKELETEVLNIVDSVIKVAGGKKSVLARINYNLEAYKKGVFDIGAAKSPAVNFKNALLKIFDNLIKDIPKQEEFYKIYLKYQEELKKRGRYDFEDMILFVLNQFKTNEDLLLTYQEKFQYILVDEYQDTNTAQNEIVQLLGSYFDVPNIFVVGDDDQSIFRFQGAAIENIYNFYQTYRSQTKLIALKNNYRSHQLILDSSQSVISNNQNRIANYIKEIDKSLVSVKTFDPDPINFFMADSCDEENYFVAEKIKSLIKKGTDPAEIAVLFRNNNDVNNLIGYLDSNEIKYHLGLGDNVLEDIRVQQIIKLLSFINDPSVDELLFQILYFDFLKINSYDLLRILRYSRSEHITLSNLIADKSKLESIDPCLRKNTIIKLTNFSIRVAKARKWLQNYSLDRFYNKFIRRFGYLKYILSLDDVFVVNHLNIFYSELKRLALTKGLTLSQFLARIDLFKENRLSLSAPELKLDTNGSINLMTVHKAKGLEFEHVFLIKCSDGKWGNNSQSSSLRLPFGILKTEISVLAADENEEERRLFYVALTRAKNQIYMSYSVKSETGRNQFPSIFTNEIDPKLIQIIKPDSDFHKKAILSVLPQESKVLISNKQVKSYLKNYLTHDYKFNVTHLNSYLKCPLCFYYKTILRIPAVKNKHAALGTAVHGSLSFLFETLKEKNSLIAEEEFLSIFYKYLIRENLDNLQFSEALNRGNEILTDYYNNYKNTFSNNCLTEYDFSHDHVFLDDIPLSGKIDKVEILPTKHNGEFDVNVIDFKTGNPDNKSKELKEDGDYFRQLVFYKILADNDPNFKYHVKSGTVDFVEKSKRNNKYVQKTINITDDHINLVKTQIKEIYQKILNLDFNRVGEDCKDEQDLHNLIKY